MDPDDPALYQGAPAELEAGEFSGDDWNRRLVVLRQTQLYARTSGREGRLPRAAWATTSDLAGS